MALILEAAVHLSLSCLFTISMRGRILLGWTTTLISCPFRREPAFLHTGALGRYPARIRFLVWGYRITSPHDLTDWEFTSLFLSHFLLFWQLLSQQETGESSVVVSDGMVFGAKAQTRRARTKRPLFSVKAVVKSGKTIGACIIRTGWDRQPK